MGKGGGGGGGGGGESEGKPSATFFTKGRFGTLDSCVPYDCFILIVIVNSPLLPLLFFLRISLCAVRTNI